MRILIAPDKFKGSLTAAEAASAMAEGALRVYQGAMTTQLPVADSGEGTLDAATAARIKLIASETALSVSEQAIRIHGGAGIMREYPVGRIHRDAFVYVIGEGTSEVQRNIIAQRVLGLPRG